jgi:hypothetical protein
MRCIRREFPLSAIALVLVACHGQGQGPRAATEPQAVEITKRYWAKESPQVDLSRWINSTRDLGDKWEVTWDVPGGSTGSPVTFEIDKRSGRILHVEGGQ